MDEREVDVTNPLAGTPGGESSDQIRARIEVTRAELDETVDAIQERLAPERLVDQAMDTIKESVREASGSVMATIKRDPFPLLLLTTGAVWMMYSVLKRRSDQGHDYDDWAAAGYSSAEEWAEAIESGACEPSAGMGAGLYESGAESARQMGEKASQKMSELSEEAQSRLGRMKHQAQELGHRGKEQMEHLRERAMQGTAKAREAAQHTYEDYPLAIGAGALAMGVALGLSLPLTRREKHMMGGMRDRLVDEARSAGRDVVERGKAVAGRAVEAAREETRAAGRDVMEHGKKVAEATREEAERQKLTPDELLGRGEQAVERMGEAGREEIRRQDI